MATMSRYPNRNCWRVTYMLNLSGKKRLRKAKYLKARAEAKVLVNQSTTTPKGGGMDG